MKSDGTAIPGRQRGAVLIVGLVFLLALTLIGITAMKSTTLQERMAGNLSDKSLAFQAAEAALTDAETFIDNLTDRPVAGTCTASACPKVIIANEIGPDDPGIWESNATQPVSDKTWKISGPDKDSVNSRPRYYIEEIGLEQVTANANETRAVFFYRVTARGVGGSATAQSILQTTFARRF